MCPKWIYPCVLIYNNKVQWKDGRATTDSLRIRTFVFIGNELGGRAKC